MGSESAQVHNLGGGEGWVNVALTEAAKRRSEANAMGMQLRQRIDVARAVWGKLLFPTSRLESWKYTNPDMIAKGPFVLAQSSEKDSEVAGLLEKARVQGLESESLLVFVDGVFSAEHSSLSQEVGVTVARVAEGSPLSEKVGHLGQHEADEFSALATALLSDGVCVTVARGHDAQVVIQIVHVVTSASQGAVVAPRLYVEADETARVTVIESHIGESSTRYLALPMVELVANAGALIDYYKIQAESEQAFHVAGLTASHARDAEIRTHLFACGGALVRNNAQALLKGSGAQAMLNGLSLLNNEQHVDNATLIHHIEPHAESREHFKGIYAGASKGVFSGTITVEKIAQKTNAFQSNQALLLSSNASIESRPQLKIWADDVKCTHGATVGQLDADALFYLRSRGIGEKDARAFLVHAFASDILSTVSSEPVKQHIEKMIGVRLQDMLG